MKLKSLVLTIALIIVVSGLALAQDDQACLAKNGYWDAAQQKCLLQGTLQISIQYPLKELADYKFADQTVTDFITAQENEVVQAFSEGGTVAPGMYSLNMTYETFNFSPEVMSLKYVISTYTGGAHPNSYFKTFTFDLINDHDLSVTDLFRADANPWPTIANIVEQDLINQMGVGADLNWIQTGSGENPDNYHSFVVTENEVIFYFDPYQVAPYAAGAFEVHIPLETLNEYLQDPFNGI